MKCGNGKFINYKNNYIDCLNCFVFFFYFFIFLSKDSLICCISQYNTIQYTTIRDTFIKAFKVKATPSTLILVKKKFKFNLELRDFRGNFD